MYTRRELLTAWVHWQIAIEGWCDGSQRSAFREKSLQGYENATRLDPLDAVAQMELAVVHAVRGEKRNARAALERALDLGRRQADLQISCANYVASILGETKRASHILDEALVLLGRRSKMHSLSILRVAVFNKDYSRALNASSCAPDFLQSSLFKALAMAGAGQQVSSAVADTLLRLPEFDVQSYLLDHPITDTRVRRDFVDLCVKARLVNMPS